MNDPKLYIDHPYGFIKGDEVYRKAALGFPELKIGVVKDSPEASLEYFEERYQALKQKIEDLLAQVQESENRGSFLMKILHLKDSLKTATVLGDLEDLLNMLTQQEEEINNIIEENRAKNLDIKAGLLEELKSALTIEDFKEKNTTVKSVKYKWLRVGEIPEDHQKLSEEFEALIQDFESEKEKYQQEFEAKQRERLKDFKALINKASFLEQSQDDKFKTQEAKRLMGEWKNLGMVPKVDGYDPWQDFNDILRNIFRDSKNKKRPKSNIFIKEKLISQAENLKGLPNIKDAVRQAHQLKDQWKKTGHITDLSRKDELVGKFKYNIEFVFERKSIEEQVRNALRNGEIEKHEARFHKLDIVKNSLMQDLNELEELQNQKEKDLISFDEKSDKILKAKIRNTERKIEIKQEMKNRLESRFRTDNNY